MYRRAGAVDEGDVGKIVTNYRKQFQSACMSYVLLMRIDYENNMCCPDCNGEEGNLNRLFVPLLQSVVCATTATTATVSTATVATIANTAVTTILTTNGVTAN